jgi:hypothetical protein
MASRHMKTSLLTCVGCMGVGLAPGSVKVSSQVQMLFQVATCYSPPKFAIKIASRRSLGIADTCLSPPAAQDLKPKKRLNLKTYDMILELGKKETARLKAVAAALAAGGGTPGQKAKAGSMEAGPSAKKAKGADAPMIEIIGDEGRGTKRSCVDEICINYILWGHSQKPQLAGVLRLDCRFAWHMTSLFGRGGRFVNG